MNRLFPPPLFRSTAPHAVVHLVIAVVDGGSGVDAVGAGAHVVLNLVAVGLWVVDHVPGADVDEGVRSVLLPYRLLAHRVHPAARGDHSALPVTSKLRREVVLP